MVENGEIKELERVDANDWILKLRSIGKTKKCYSEHGKCSICLENNIPLVLFQCGNGHTFCNTCNISLWQLTQHCPVCRGIKKY